jgi:hypothetical protein
VSESVAFYVRFKCRYCGNKYSSIENLDGHVAKVHSEGVRETVYINGKRAATILDNRKGHYFVHDDSYGHISNNWEVICDMHAGICVDAETLALAKFLARHTSEFCEFCAGTARWCDKHNAEYGAICGCLRYDSVTGDLIEVVSSTTVEQGATMSKSKLKPMITDAELIRVAHSDFHRCRFVEGKSTFTAIFMDGEKKINGEIISFGVDTKREAIRVAREYGFRFLDGAKVIGWMEDGEE